MKISPEDLKRRLEGSLTTRLLEKENESKKENRGNDENNRNNAGRKEEIPNAPKSLRVVAGVLSKIDNGVEAARATGLTNGQARYAEKTSNRLTEQKVQDIALTRLMDALGLLTLPAMIGEKPKDISAIAANLSRVHSNLRDREGERGNSVNVTIYAPQQKKLEDFEVIEVQQTGT